MLGLNGPTVTGPVMVETKQENVSVTILNQLLVEDTVLVKQLRCSFVIWTAAQVSYLVSNTRLIVSNQ